MEIFVSFFINGSKAAYFSYFWTSLANFRHNGLQTSGNNSTWSQYLKNIQIFGQYLGSNSRLISGSIFDSTSSQIPIFWTLLQLSGAYSIIQIIKKLGIRLSIRLNLDQSIVSSIHRVLVHNKWLFPLLLINLLQTIFSWINNRSNKNEYFDRSNKCSLTEL